MSNVFKKKDEVFQVAGQNELFKKYNPDGTLSELTFDDWHESISEIKLESNVPDSVRTYFDVAKNVYLYSWFSYEMMAASSLLSCTLIEKSLRIIYNCEKKSRPSFSQLFNQAIEDGLLNDSGFHMSQNSAFEREVEIDGTIYIETYKRTVEELKLSQSYIRPLSKSIPRARNQRAHGNSSFHPGGRLALKVDSEIINMLFNNPIDPAELKKRFQPKPKNQSKQRQPIK